MRSSKPPGDPVSRSMPSRRPGARKASRPVMIASYRDAAAVLTGCRRMSKRAMALNSHSRRGRQGHIQVAERVEVSVQFGHFPGHYDLEKFDFRRRHLCRTSGHSLHRGNTHDADACEPSLAQSSGAEKSEITIAAPASCCWASDSLLRIATVSIPAAVADRIPVSESSKASASDAPTPSCWRAVR